MSETTPVPPLKPCPFCEPRTSLRPPYVGNIGVSLFCVCCDGCGLLGPNGATRAVAVAAWNERPGEAALLAFVRAILGRVITDPVMADRLPPAEWASIHDMPEIGGYTMRRDEVVAHIAIRWGIDLEVVKAAIASVEPQPERPA